MIMQILPLTKAQQRVWLEWKLTPDSPAYNNPLLYRLIGAVAIDKLEKALQMIVDSQPALRCFFIEQAGVPKQCLVDNVKVTLDYHDVSALDTQTQHPQIKKITAENVEQGFNLALLPLFRFTLIKTNKDDYLFILNIHHIVVDGYSANLLIQQISNYYNNEIVSESNQDDKYIDYLTHVEGPTQEQMQFWADHFQDANFHIDLYSEINSAVSEDKGHRKRFTIPKELTKQIKSLAKKNKTTDFVVLMAAFYVVLAKFSNQQDLSLGYAIDTRRSNQKELFGFFVNNVPLRLSFSSLHTFQDIILQLTQLRKAIKSNQSVDYMDIIQHVRKENVAASKNLYNVSFIRANFALNGLNLSGIQVLPLPLFTGAVKDDISLLYDETDTFEFEIEYKLKRYASDYIQDIEEAYLACLEAIVLDASVKLHNMNIFPCVPNNFTINTAVADNLITRFIRATHLDPNKIAIYSSEGNVTYADLQHSVHCYISYFQEQNLKTGQPVAVYLERSPSLIAAFLALQWLGIPYIPLDMNTPAERLAAIMQESKAIAIITDTQLIFSSYRILALSNAINKKDIPQPISSDISYIIYTSGSTGKPKGVAVGPTALNNFLASMQNLFLKEKDDILLAITTVAFDISMLELFLPIWCGRSLFLCNQKQHKDPFEINKIINENAITLLQATPAMWSMLLETGFHSKTELVALCGGEALSPALAKQLQSNCKAVWNMYGPTEATIWCSAQKIEEANRITVGKPIANMHFFILDEENNVLPAYVKGELCLAGTGLANGYFNREDLTQEKFIYHPQLNLRLYRTGDIACFNRQGECVVFGRKDNQIKLNGYRIELNEIEVQLQAISAIKQAVVIAHQQQLLAYLTQQGPIDTDTIARQLALSLPDYMLPKHYIVLDTLPITPSGKIDRKKLPLPETTFLTAYDGPETVLERQWQSIWNEAFQTRVSVTAHFYQLGGHSLLAVQLLSRLREMYGIELSISDFFTYPTIRSSSAYLELAKNKNHTILKTDLTYYPLTSVQQRFWLASQFKKHSPVFNMAATLSIHGELNKEKWQSALEQLAIAHPVLDTVISLQDETPFQKRERHSLSLTIYNKDALSVSPAHFLSEWASQPFELLGSPLWRACLVRVSQTDFILGLCLHHIIGDGYSVPILIRDLLSFYDGQTPSTANISYFDYVHWETQQIIPLEKLEFWQKELLHCPYLQLPKDGPQLNPYDNQGEQHVWSLNELEWQAVRTYCQQEKVSITTYFVACFSLLLQRLSGFNEFCIGLPVANRDHADTYDMVGCFLNLLPIRIHVPSQLNFSEWIQGIHKHIQYCTQAGNVPFSALLEKLSIPREWGKTPLFNTLINVQPDPFNVAYSSTLPINMQLIHTKTSKYDLTMDLYFSDKGLTGYCEYASDLFTAHTISNWCQLYQSLLMHYAYSPEQDFNHSMPQLSKAPILASVINEKKGQRIANSNFQKRIALIWEKSLGKTPVYLDDNFFSLGGHSLLAAKMISMTSKELGISIPLETIFIHSLFEDFCAALETLSMNDTKPNVENIIRKINERKIPLTPNQRQLALLYAEEKQDLYHLGVLIKWPHQPNIEQLQQSINQVCNQYAIYRWQLIHANFAELADTCTAPLHLLFCHNNEETLLAAKNFVAQPFDLRCAPLLRLALIEQANGHFYLVISMHHLIGDEWSLELFAKSIYQTHQMFPVSNPNFDWQDYLLSREEKPALVLEYWRQYILAQAPTRIPPTITHSANKQKIGKRCEITIPFSTMNACHETAKYYGVSLYTVLLALYFVFLRYFTAEKSLSITTTYDRRKSASLQNLHGYLVNLLPVNVNLENIETFETLIHVINQDRIKGIQYADIDFASLVEENIASKPHVVFNFQHAYDIENHEITSEQAKFPFVLHLRYQNKQGMHCAIEYDSSSYDANFIENCMHAFTFLIHQLPENRNKKLIEWQLTDSPLVLTDTTCLPVNHQKNFIGLLEEIGLEHKDKIAVYYDGKTISYGELWKRVTKLSNAILHDYGNAITNKVIAVSLPNSADYIIAILATLRLNAAFLPIPTDYPEARQQQMISDSQAIGIIRDSLIFSKFDNQTSQPEEEFAYIIYTSGTTGKPKGVPITQKQLHVFINALQNKLSINHHDNILQFSSISFDASIWEIFLALYSAAALFIPNVKERRVGESLQCYLHQHAISHALLTPSVLQTVYPDDLPHLRSVASGGEACTSALIARWADKVDFYNAYGPTEATICTNMALVSVNGESSYIGKALGDAKLQIISDNLQALPRGAIGELLISGDVLTAGYIKQPVLNQEKFIYIKNERCYKSGDLARILSHDQVQYLGRQDKQIKLRGLRIELGEVEAELQRNVSIQQAVCVVKQDQLWAYFVSQQTIDTKALFTSLTQQLPAFMLPNQLIQIESIPLLASGKIDYAALPDLAATPIDQVAPRNEIESQLYTIWLNYLPLTSFSIEQDFFFLGGNSLHAMQIAADIAEIFQVDLSVHDFYRHTTIESQATFIGSMIKNNNTDLENMIDGLSADEQLELLKMIENC